MSALRRAEPAPPVRMVHLGLGNFFRAHQAWYTAQSPDASSWGIAAFTGRSAQLAEALGSQDGLYTLVTRGADGDRFDVLGSVVRAHPAGDHEAWLGYLADPAVVLVTLTVTEAGYVRAPDGALDLDDQGVSADVAALRGDPRAPVRTAPGRLVAGLLARRAAGAGPLTVVPCDNLPDNGTAVHGVVTDMAQAVDPGLLPWLDQTVSFVTTMVDRITPRTTADDVRAVAEATGADDAAPVVTEPFSEWVLSGSFPGGRPQWEDAGATVTDDVAPYEQRKLWLLNGAHSLLAYAGSVRGHETVADAIADPQCRQDVVQWWSEASPHLPLAEKEVEEYRSALLERFENPRIRHLLAQIAADGSQKLPVRVLPVLRRERAAGHLPSGAVTVLAAWVAHLRGAGGAPVQDPRADELVPLAGGPLEEAVPALLWALDSSLATDGVVRAVAARVAELMP